MIDIAENGGLVDDPANVTSSALPSLPVKNQLFDGYSRATGGQTWGRSELNHDRRPRETASSLDHGAGRGIVALAEQMRVGWQGPPAGNDDGASRQQDVRGRTDIGGTVVPRRPACCAGHIYVS